MFGKKKLAKSQQPDKGPYTLYNPHTRDLEERNWSTDFIRVCSIDPAVGNFAIRVETRPKYEKPDFITCQLFTKISFKIDLSSSTKSTGMDDFYYIFDALTYFLDKYLDLFKTCHLIVIERQLPENYRAVRLSQHALSYFLIHLRDSPLLPIILELDSKVKGHQLGAGVTGQALKKWSIVKATELLTQRRDQYSLDILESFKTKKDDLADTVCQIEALFTLWGWPLTIDPPVIPNVKFDSDSSNKDSRSKKIKLISNTKK